MSDILAEKLQKLKKEDEYMVNTFIVILRKLGTAGQKLGGGAILRHIKHDPVDPGGSFALTSANVGECQTVPCRNGKPWPLSRLYIMCCEEEQDRIKQHKAIVTEDGIGVTESTHNPDCHPPPQHGASPPCASDSTGGVFHSGQ
ncbi:hypothetical protein U0070_018853 [Myodes glareolus]|uniref:Uncharacterized protein n=1 Tax=Myodes glareolus TaxID=447135 RepID=A0AAW0JTV9_MYOGA